MAGRSGRKRMVRSVIVVQRHIENVVGICREVETINKERAKEILFTTDPGEVVENVGHGEPVLVVSGQIFAEAGERSGIRRGVEFARILKSKNPNVLILIYSTMPEKDSLIDGFIPKSWGTVSSGQHALLPEIILAYKKGMTVSDLKKNFPELQLG
jgi:hypothetical protein